MACLVALGGVSLVADVILAPPAQRSFKIIIVLSTMISIRAVLRFWQEFCSTQAAEENQGHGAHGLGAARGQRKAAGDTDPGVVPGDIVSLSAGDMIPADARLLASNDLFISEAVRRANPSL